MNRGLPGNKSILPRLHSYFLPETEQTHCYFEASDAEAVREVNERANIPLSSITEVMMLTPEAV